MVIFLSVTCSASLEHCHLLPPFESNGYYLFHMFCFFLQMYWRLSVNAHVAFCLPVFAYMAPLMTCICLCGVMDNCDWPCPCVCCMFECAGLWQACEHHTLSL
ncbi:hypothetical protein COLO4_20237 [Corchorus olitorius]|uniref:Uncharacterized protein n=1 Tax=Corchorus olitorius TaxID=93759 RepID=A0A1R3J158_9ROSI|nr:hypothetical protein COLO4_20237 [Corchorus olitorius]